MRKNLTGGYTSAVQGDHFFLTKEGRENPLAELKETYKQMFEQSAAAEKTQCRFLARRDFFPRHSKLNLSGEFKTCAFSADWLARLNAQKVSLIFAAGYLNSAGSSFGHTFLRLESPSNANRSELLDYGINFAARTSQEKGALYALYGLFGFFPGSYSMLPYHQMIKDYSNLEGRDLWEYQLNLTLEEVKRLQFHLLELEGSYFDYYFLSDNCSFEILKLIEIARPGMVLAKDSELFMIPLDAVKTLKSLITTKKYRPSLETKWQLIRKNLKPERRKAILDFKQSLNSASALTIEELEAAQSYLALKEVEDPKAWSPKVFELSKERAKRGGQVHLESEVATPSSPDQSPNSSALQLGYLEAGEKSPVFGFHFAFHDSYSRDAELSPFSHLELGAIQFGKYLQRYRILEMLSTKAINQFETPVSWGLILGGDQDVFEPQKVRSKALGRVGLSFDLADDQWRVTNLLLLGAAENSEGHAKATAGVSSRLWGHWNTWARSGLEATVLRMEEQEKRELTFTQAFDLNSQLELRLHLSECWQDSQTAHSAGLHQNFLF